MKARNPATLNSSSWLIALVVSVAALAPSASRPAWAVAPWGNGLTPAVTDLVNDPLRFYSFDPGVVTWKMTQEFRDVFSSPAAQEQVRLAFGEWEKAFTSNLRRMSLQYSWSRYNGPQEFYDLQSVMIHEIGHALGSQHPDAAWFNGTPQYMLNFRPDVLADWVPSPPLGGEIMNEGNAVKELNGPGSKGLLDGEYWRTVSTDEVDFLDHVYSNGLLQFQEVGPNDEAMLSIRTFGTPGGPSSGTLGIAGPDNSETRANGGARIIDASIEISASAPIGIIAKSQTWEVLNHSGKDIDMIRIQTRGTSSPWPLKATSGGQHRFTEYEPDQPSFEYAFDFEDRVHTYRAPETGSVPNNGSVQFGIQLDVWDWSLVWSRARSTDGDAFDIDLAPPGIKGWFNYHGGAVVEPPNPGDGILTGLSGARVVDVPAVGFVVSGVENARTTITHVAVGAVDDPFLGPDDLGTDLLDALRDAGELYEFDVDDISLGADDDFVFVLRGAQQDLPTVLQASNRYLLLDLPEIADRPFVAYVRTETADFTIGAYAMLNSGLIRVPEPSLAVLLAHLVGMASLATSRSRK